MSAPQHAQPMQPGQPLTLSQTRQLVAEDIDTAHCQALLAQGSKSFAFAGRLLPAAWRADIAALYAFCRVADDVIDGPEGQHDPAATHAALAQRLQTLCSASVPEALSDPVDRALARVLRRRALPASLLQALLDGFLWDAQGRRYETLGQTLAYCSRVAGSVGVMLASLTDSRAPHILARAADMGVAMQLVNIARDVGEDARRGRLYLPGNWLREQGLQPEAFLAAPAAHPAIKHATARLLRLADGLFARARLGLHDLDWRVRPAMAAAGRIYQDIGGVLRKQNLDNVTQRAHTTAVRKVWLVLQAMCCDGHRPRRLQSKQRLMRPSLPQNADLVQAAQQEA